MTESAGNQPGVDESAFGADGETSHDADVDAAFDDQQPDSAADVTGAADSGADEDVPDSYEADIAASFDDQSDVPTQQPPV